jgi:site-specific DNA-methyltransferase (adenine-specific)
MEPEIANPQSQIANPKSEIQNPKLPAPVFHDPKHHIKIYQGDCLEILPAIPENCVDLIFADPPYFLSNDGITCHAGRMVSVNKGAWDRSQGPDSNGDCCSLRAGSYKIARGEAYEPL